MNGNKGDSPSDTGRESAFALFAQGLRKSFRQGKRIAVALDDAGLKAEKGKITGLVGPDGAGKTTLMRLSAGLLKSDAGTVTVLGMDALNDSLNVQAAIGYMPQRFGLYEDLSVMENLDLYADLQGIGKEERKTQYEELMRMTRLGEFQDRLAGRLSGGMKQKLGLACTMVRSPEFLLLDEPTVGVDPVSRRELWAIVNRLVEKQGMSVLLSTTYLDEAERCDEVVLLHEGKVLDQGKPGELSARQAGKTWTISAPGMRKRRLQKKISREKNVLDAIIVGEVVRVVTKDDCRPSVEFLGIESEKANVQNVPPRFEDEYVALLKRRKEKKTGPVETLSESKADEAAFASDESVIQVEHVKRRFGDFYAVKDVTFDVKRGEVFGLLGANGAGKTTTFRMICGLLPPSEGTLLVAGSDLRVAAAEARAQIGYMSQKFSLYGQLSVLENLDFFSGAYNLSGRRKRRRVQWAMEQFGLKEIAASTSGELPLGFKQRLALACALMHEPKILFLDEPTSGVDPMARREFWDHINQLAENGVTVMVTTHFMEEAEYCDRLALMIAGQILALGTPAEVKDKARKTSQKAIETMEEAFIALIESRTENDDD